MNLLDLIIFAGLGLAGIGGFYYGFVARALSWLGAAGGLVATAALLPLIIRALGAGATIFRLFVTVMAFVIGATVGGSIGETIGRRLRHAIPAGPLRLADRIGGAIAGVVGTLVLIWFLTPIAADVPGLAARQIRNSAVVSSLSQATPRPPGPAQALRGLIGSSRFPEVFEGLSPAPASGTPPDELPLSREVLQRVTAATVNVESVACGVTHEGSGFAVADNLVATNAHVVAGSSDLQVRRPDGRVLSAEVVVFDDDRDLALLAVDDLGQRPLEVADANTRTQGAIVGYPGGQNQPRPQAAGIDSQRTAVGRDIYGQERVRREIYIIAANLAQGDSGAPLVNTRGQVVGVAFAIAPDRPATAYTLIDDELAAVLDAPRDDSPGPCL